MAKTTFSRRTAMQSAAVAGVASPALLNGGSIQAHRSPAFSSLLQSDEPITLQVWQTDWGQFYNEPMIQLSDAFTKDVAPNVTIEWTFLPDLSQKLISAIAGGQPPDIASIDEEYGVPKMASVGGLESLNDYYAQDNLELEGFIPFSRESVLLDGDTYGIPGGAGAVCLLFDKEMFSEVGIDVEAIPDPISWDTFLDWNSRLEKRDDTGKLQRVGYFPTANVFIRWAGVLGFHYYNDDHTQLLVNTPESVAAVEKWASLLPAEASFEDVDALMSGASTNPMGALGSGLAGIGNAGYWVFSAFDKFWPDLDYGVAKLPTPNGTKDEWSLYTGWNWTPAIPKGAKHPDEAWAFLKYAFWEHGEMLADTLNWTCVLDKFDPFVERTRDIMGPENRMQPYLQHFADSQIHGEYAVPYTPIHEKLRDMLTTAIDHVLRGEKDAQSALDAVVDSLQPELEQASTRATSTR